MIEFVCTNCSKNLRVKDEYAGRQGNCTCGHRLTIPTASLLPEKSTTADSVERISLQCECGLKLAVPKTAIGKAARCKCGTVIRVPASGTTSANTPPGPSTPIAPQIPVEASDGLFGNPSIGKSGQSRPPAFPSFPTVRNNAQAPYDALNTSFQAANIFCQNDVNESQHVPVQSSGWNPINRQTGLGLSMMFGAVLWFAVALMFGYFFPYTIILLIAGIVVLIKGLINIK